MVVDFTLLEQRIRNSYRYITKNMAPNDEDDCVQDVLLSYWKNGKGQTVEQAVIDFLRKNGSGRKGKKSYEARRKLQTTSELPETLVSDDGPGYEVDVCEGIDERVKQIILLLEEGHTLNEVGEMFGISHSRVCQIRKNFKEKMKFLSRLPREIRRWAIIHVF